MGNGEGEGVSGTGVSGGVDTGVGVGVGVFGAVQAPIAKSSTKNRGQYLMDNNLSKYTLYSYSDKSSIYGLTQKPKTNHGGV